MKKLLLLCCLLLGLPVAAQAADELLNIIGIDASFVISPDGERVNISGRSMGSTNVQIILEKLGGGGNAAAAGGQAQGHDKCQQRQKRGKNLLHNCKLPFKADLSKIFRGAAPA